MNQPGSGLALTASTTQRGLYIHCAYGHGGVRGALLSKYTEIGNSSFPTLAIKMFWLVFYL
jgi:hypothetical protein